MDPAKMKVVDLRSELGALGFDTKGNKPALVERMKKVLEAKTERALPNTSILDTTTEGNNEGNRLRASPATRTRRRSSSSTVGATPAKLSRRESPEPVEEVKVEGNKRYLAWSDSEESRSIFNPVKDNSPVEEASQTLEEKFKQEIYSIDDKEKSMSINEVNGGEEETQDDVSTQKQPATNEEIKRRKRIKEEPAIKMEVEEEDKEVIKKDAASRARWSGLYAILRTFQDSDEESESEEVYDEVEEIQLEDLDVVLDDRQSPVFVESSSGVERSSIVNTVQPDAGDAIGDVEDSTEDLAAFMVADEHEKFPSQVAGTRDRSPIPGPAPGVSPRNIRCPQARARRGGGRRGRGRVYAASSAPHTWKLGRRLVQVCVTDEDVPPALSVMVENHVRSREGCEAENQRRERKKRCRVEEVDNVEFYDADNGQDFALLSDESRHFEWLPMDSFRGQRETFIHQSTGAVSNHTTMYDAFRSYWDDGILANIVEETNRYASSIPGEAFKAKWYDTNVHEILVLFAFFMMLGIHKMPTIKSCFTLNPLLKTEVFRSMFTSARYQHLVRALHFANNEARPLNTPRLYCFGRVLEHLNSKFQENFVPAQNIVIDESLTLWKGMLLFKQYIRTKVARFGIKTFELCDCATGYLWSFIVYTGESSNDGPASDSAILKSTEVVIKLIRPLLNKGYTLFLDNWFNSPVLARFLKSNGTDCVGTLRPTRKGVSPVIAHAELRRGEFVARHAGDIVAMAWKDNKKLLAISTYHGLEQGSVTTGREPRRIEQWKPKLVLDHNKNMSGVNRKDQMLEPYLLERKRCKKWYMKLFKRLLNCSIFNSRILVESSSGKQLDQLASRLELVDAIISRHNSLVPRSRLTPRSVTVDRRTMHWPAYIGSIAGTNNRIRQRCVICLEQGRKHIKTIYKCERCDVPLCIINCFKQFHV